MEDKFFIKGFYIHSIVKNGIFFSTCNDFSRNSNFFYEVNNKILFELDTDFQNVNKVVNTYFINEKFDFNRGYFIIDSFKQSIIENELVRRVLIKNQLSEKIFNSDYEFVEECEDDILSKYETNKSLL